MYPEIKILTEEEYGRWKEKDITESSDRNPVMSYKPRGQMFEMKKNRKDQQRDLNANVKILNKQIENDCLWRGRFFVRQIKASWYEFDDKSGGDLYVQLRFYDKKDNVYVDTFESARCLCYGHTSVFWLMNKAITEIFNVWPRNSEVYPSPYVDRVLYSSIPDEYTIKAAHPLNADYNYFSL